MLTVCAFQDDAAAFDAVQGTMLCEKLVEFLDSSFRSLEEKADKLDVGQVEEINVNWLEAHHLLTPTGCTPNVLLGGQSNNEVNENFPGKVLNLLINK